MCCFAYCYSRGPHYALNVHLGSAQCFIYHLSVFMSSILACRVPPGYKCIYLSTEEFAFNRFRLILTVRLNKDLFSKCHYSFCSDGIYIIKMSKQWANDSSIRIMGKGTSTVQSCIQLPIFEDCFTGQCLLLKRSTLCSQCASWLSTMFYLSINCHIK